MILQCNVTVIEYRRPGQRTWTQGLVREVLPRKRVRVEDIKGKLFTLPLSQTRERIKPMHRAMQNARRRKHVPVDVKAINRTHIDAWMSRKRSGPTNTLIASILERAAELDYKEFVTDTNVQEVNTERELQKWEDKLAFHDPRVNPITGQRLPN